MARTKAAAKRSAPEPAEQQVALQAPIPKSIVPEPLRFPLLVALNITLSGILYTLVSPFTKGDLATVSAHRDQWWEIIALLSWKAVELAVGWWGGYDSEYYEHFFVPLYQQQLTARTSHRSRMSNLPDPCPLPILPHQLLPNLARHSRLLHRH